MTCTHPGCARPAVPHRPADRHPAGLCDLHADVWCVEHPVPKPPPARPDRRQARERERPNRLRNAPLTLAGVPYENANDAAAKLKLSPTAVLKRMYREQDRAAAMAAIERTDDEP